MTDGERDKKENKQDKNNTGIIALAIFLIAGGLGFFAGMKYQESKQPEFMRNMPQEFLDRMGNRQFGDRTGNVGLRPVSGEIIEVDDGSVTLKTQDGGSKIVIYSDNTPVNKTSEGSLDDLKEGEQTMVIGKEGVDGTVTADTISIGGNYFRGIPQEEPPMESN